MQRSPREFATSEVNYNTIQSRYFLPPGDGSSGAHGLLWSTLEIKNENWGIRLWLIEPAGYIFFGPLSLCIYSSIYIIYYRSGGGPTAYFIPGRVGWGVGPRQIVVCLSVCLSSVVCRLSVVCLSVCRPPREPPARVCIRGNFRCTERRGAHDACIYRRTRFDIFSKEVRHVPTYAVYP